MADLTPPPTAARFAYGELADSAPTDPEAIDGLTQSLIGRLSLDERIGLLSGDGPFIRSTLDMAKRYNGEPIVAGAVSRLGLPGIRFTDGPRGVVMYSSTAFPSPMARAATFDPELEARIGDAIGVEARTQGANLFAGVCINLLRHPAWGRAQETYGEDSHLLGEMGAALVRGTQRHVMACVKHFALNSMENSRLWLDVQVAEADLRDLYLPHFRRCIDEGAAAVMTAYNKVDGSPCGHQHHLITEILKGEWGFRGFVMSDFTFGVRSASAAVNAGLDLEMPYEGFFKRLRGLVARGRVPATRIDDAAERLVRTQIEFASHGEPDRYVPEVLAGAEHRALAREAASRSMVLLRNEAVGTGAMKRPMLPLDPSTTRSLAVIGWLAAEENLGDLGSSQVHPPSVVTLLDGLTAAADRTDATVHHIDGRDLDAAAALAASCDAVVVVVGSTWRDEGEWILKAGGDRRTLRLAPHDEALVRRVSSENDATAVVLMGGSAFVTDAWEARVAAVLMAWYPGMEGGHAVADVLWGAAAPEGRLPCTWPGGLNRLPPFARFRRRIRYGPLFGYRLMEATGQDPAHWFGHGLTYGTVSWGPPRLRTLDRDGANATVGARGAIAQVSVELTNDGPGSVVEVVQAYVPEVLGTHPAALNALRAFQRVEVPPGERVEVTLDVPVPDSASVVRVGRSARPSDLVDVRLDGGRLVSAE